MKTLSKSLTLFSMLFLLFACGGGDSLERDSDSSTDSDDTSDATYTVSLSVVNQNNETDRNLATDNPLTVIVTVTDEEGSALADTLVTFTLSNDELADFSNDTGTARTDDSGQATIGLTVGSAAGDGLITATLPDGTTESTTFTSEGSDVAVDPEYSVTFSLVNSSGEEDKDLSADNPLTLNLTVVDQYDNPLSDSLISFTLSNDELANFSNDTAAARTNDDGEASIGLTVGYAAGDGEITVTLPDGTTASTTFTSEGSDVALDPEYSVTFSLVNSSGEEDRNLASDNPLIVNLTVVDQNDNPLTDALISFELSNDNLAVFTSDTSSARTDESGKAIIGLTVGAAAGDGQIIATLPDGTTATTTFTSEGSDVALDPEYSVTFSLVNSSGEEDKDLSATNPLTVNITVVDQNDDPLTDALITFTLSNDELADFSNDTGTARTDDSGQATIGLTVGTASGDGQVTATLPDGTTDSTTFTSSGTALESEEPAKVELYANSLQLASSGSDEIELIAVVKNAQSNLMEGVEVSFSASIDDNVEIQQVDDETTESGTATAYVTTLNDASQREVTITATAGDEVATVTFEVVGTEVTVNGATAITINDSTDLTIRVQDSDGNNLTNQDVTLTTTLGELSTSVANTGTEGQDTVTFTATESGEATITASALGVETQFTITVQEDEFAFTTVPDDYIDVAPDDDYEDADYATITLTWKKDNAAYPGGTVTFTASRGEIRDGDETGVTDNDGEISFDIASTNAGDSTITATGVDSDGNSVTATVVVEFVATVADSLYADASPDQIGPDGETSTITAVVRDPAGNLVKDKVVSFTVDDTSTGSISPSQSTTNSSGIASTVFTSAAVTSEDAVVITASVLDDTAVTDSVTLTVGNRAFDVSIGTGNEISKPDDTTYLKEFAVFVTDSVGQPIEGVELTASLTPVKYTNDGKYYKGYWVWVDPNWEVGYTVEDSDGNEEIVYGYTSTCPNEDINANGILDAGEDVNGDTYLTPGIVGSLSFQDGVTTTDENGQATLELRYQREYAAFYEAEIAVFAQSTGSEASASMEYIFGISAEDVSNESIQPQSSPFGTAYNDCSTTE